MRLRLLPVSLLLGACAGAASNPAPAPQAQKTAAPKATAKNYAQGVDSPQLQQLFNQHWRWVLQQNPIFATRLGIHDFDHLVGMADKATQRARTEQKQVFLKAAETLLKEKLSARDQVSLELFAEELKTDLASEPCRFSDWSISARSNPVVDWNYLPKLHAVENVLDLRNLLARYNSISEVINQQAENLKRGAQNNLVISKESLERIISVIENQLEKPVKDWPLAEPQFQKNKFLDSYRMTSNGSAEVAKFTVIISEQIKPALERYLAVLKTDLLPKARPAGKEGLAALSLGPQCYSARIRRFTTLERDAETIHQIGLQEIERINQEMAALGKKILDAKDLAETLKKLRSDEKLYFDTSEAVENKAKSALAKARAAMPKYFGILPKADCVVTPIPDYEAPYTTIAYYRQPVPDGSQPGQYFINTYQPKTRPRYEAEALAFHEAIPGHHLQIAISQELPELPEFRKHMGMTAFVEGWALYTEQLSKEMGLYSGDLDLMGMLSYEAWRASRLVVDTGLHAKGWSREQAKQFMYEHTALAANNIDNEVDRYISWPGQALAYKTGQMEIWKLRRAAEKTLGEKFDIKGFHDAVLGGGAVTLSVLKAQVDAWVKSVQATPAS